MHSLPGVGNPCTYTMGIGDSLAAIQAISFQFAQVMQYRKALYISISEMIDLSKTHI
jgi:hypothetical protein